MNKTKHSQKGVILVVALIMLLVMTGVGVTLMSGATLQERMAGNSRQFALAQANAEAALRRAEKELRDEIIVDDTNETISQAVVAFMQANTDGSRYIDFEYSPSDATGSVAARPVTDDMTQSSNWSEAGGYGSVTATVTTTSDRQPQYLIKYLGQTTKNTFDTSLDVSVEKKDQTLNLPHFFSITAIGFGADEDIYAVLQSTYSTGSN